MNSQYVRRVVNGWAPPITEMDRVMEQLAPYITPMASVLIAPRIFGHCSCVHICMQHKIKPEAMVTQLGVVLHLSRSTRGRYRNSDLRKILSIVKY